jgi:hypothetical protein
MRSEPETNRVANGRRRGVDRQRFAAQPEEPEVIRAEAATRTRAGSRISARSSLGDGHCDRLARESVGAAQCRIEAAPVSVNEPSTAAAACAHVPLRALLCYRVED